MSDPVDVFDEAATAAAAAEIATALPEPPTFTTRLRPRRSRPRRHQPHPELLLARSPRRPYRPRLSRGRPGRCTRSGRPA